MTKASANVFTKLIGAEAAAPGTPASATAILYVKADGLWYSKDDVGTETLVSGGAAGGSVATDAIWDAAGDLAVGSGANTAAKLTIGAAGGHVARINGAVAWNSGTAFPTAVAGDRYWRTDLGLEAYYDGTRWLSTTLYREQLYVGSAAMPLSATGTGGRWTPWHTTYDLWMDTFHVSTWVDTTNDGSKFWTLTFRKDVVAWNTPVTIATFTTGSGPDTASNWVTRAVAVGALFTPATYKMAELICTKTSTPGNLYVGGAAITYRVVLT